METIVINEEGCVSSSEKTSTMSDDIFQESQDCETSKPHTEERDTQNEEDMQNFIDLDSTSTICIETSDEEDASEQPSTDIKLALHERTQKLRSEMAYLQGELDKEVALCRKEKEEFQLLREQSDTLAFEEATAAARAAAAAYAAESPLSNNLTNVVDITSEQSIKELRILEYEKDLAKYKDSYSFEQAEQRYNSYKRVLVDDYKKKLTEVERLCNEELERLCQSAKCLQPFKEIASKWSMEENDHGDFGRSYNDQCNTEQSKLMETECDTNNCYVSRKIDKEVNMVSEMLSAQFKREEI